MEWNHSELNLCYQKHIQHHFSLALVQVKFSYLRDDLFSIQRTNVLFKGRREVTSYNYLKQSAPAIGISQASPSQYIFCLLSAFLEPFTNKFDNVNIKNTHEKHYL